MDTKQELLRVFGKEGLDFFRVMAEVRHINQNLYNNLKSYNHWKGEKCYFDNLRLAKIQIQISDDILSLKTADVLEKNLQKLQEIMSELISNAQDNVPPYIQNKVKNNVMESKDFSKDNAYRKLCEDLQLIYNDNKSYYESYMNLIENVGEKLINGLL
jgi:hypothetical protein